MRLLPRLNPMARTALAVSFAVVLISCGRPRLSLPARPFPAFALRSSGLQRVALDQAYRDALAALGDKCSQVGAQGSVAAAYAPPSASFGGSAQQMSGSAKNPRPRAIHDLEQLAYLDDIEIAQFHAAKNELVVMGPPAQNQTGIRPDDFLAVFRALSSGEAPGVTIDPQPDTRFMQVRYFGHIEGTQLGLSLFDADRLLKLMSTGFDNDNCHRWEGMPSQITPELTLFTDDLSAKGNAAIGQAQWHRFWFEFNDLPVERDDEHLAIRIPVDRLAVNEQSVPAGYKSPNSALVFANALSKNFLTLTKTFTSFRDVQRAAAVTSLAKWVIDKQIPVEKEWLSSQPSFASTPGATPRISVTRTAIQGDHLVQTGIEGGVDFQKPNTYRQNPGAVNVILQAAEASAQPKQSIWDFMVHGKAYRAVRLVYAHPVRLRPQTTVWYRTVRIGIPRSRVLDVRIPVSKLSITNKTSALLTLDVTGVKTQRINVASVVTEDIELAPGVYDLAVTSSCGQLKDSLSVKVGEQYSASYSCEPVISAPPVIPQIPVRIPEPAPSTGSLSIQNVTGGSITIRLFGASNSSYTAPAGSSTFTLPAGSYSMSASSRCGSRADSFAITPGGTAIETYSCVPQ